MTSLKGIEKPVETLYSDLTKSNKDLFDELFNETMYSYPITIISD